MIDPSSGQANQRNRTIKIGLAGNPNSGKTTVFNSITGSRQHVGNYPGVTVEKKEGHRKYEGFDLHIVDLPGTYSLTAYSIEEIVSRNFICNERPDVLIQVLDVTNLERNLYLTTQLVELRSPLVLALNMADAAEAQGLTIDLKRLAEIVGAPVVPTVGTTGKGIPELLSACLAVFQSQAPESREVHVDFGSEFEEHIFRLTERIMQMEAAGTLVCALAKGGDCFCERPRWLSLKLLEQDKQVVEQVRRWDTGQELLDFAERERKHLESIFKDEVESVLAERRYGFVAGAIKEVLTRPLKERVDLSERIDSVLTHRILGMPIFFLMVWAMFQITFTVGAYPTEWLDIGVGWLSETLAGLLGDGLLKGLLVDGIVNGVGGVLVFMPNIFLLFACISFLEDSGYMSRAAFLMDRVMHMLGLHGKSFIPLLMGFGCNAPAIMACRTLESERDRILTILINPLISCSARLPIYILITGAFFAPRIAGTVIFSIYLLGILLAVLIGKLFSRTILKGEAAPFVMELPPYRMPTLKSTVIHMWDRGKIFLRKMGGVILVGSILIWTLSAFPLQVEYTRDYQSELEIAAVEDKAAIEIAREKERVQGSYIGRIGDAIHPFFKPLGFDWRDGVAIITGFVAKEIVVSTLGVLHQVGEDEDEQSEGLKTALASSGKDRVTAYAFMAFVLIYTPCLGTLAVIRRETNSRKWTIFSVVYGVVLAWIVAAIINIGGHLLGLA